jgi:hypothetical protein
MRLLDYWNRSEIVFQMSKIKVVSCYVVILYLWYTRVSPVSLRMCLLVAWLWSYTSCIKTQVSVHMMCGL